MFKKKGGGVKGFLTNVKKLQNWYFGHPFKSNFEKDKHMNGRHTYMNGVQNLHSVQSDKSCEFEVHMEFGFKRRM